MCQSKRTDIQIDHCRSIYVYNDKFNERSYSFKKSKLFINRLKCSLAVTSMNILFVRCLVQGKITFGLLCIIMQIGLHNIRPSQLLFEDRLLFPLQRLLGIQYFTDSSQRNRYEISSQSRLYYFKTYS